MIKQDYILLILNCKVYKHKAESQKNTWLKTLPKNIKYYHVIGDTKLSKPYIFNDDENILYLKCKDNYNSLPKKVINAFYAVNKEFDFKYIFKTDDDQKLIKPQFFHSFPNILSIKQDCHYGGFSLYVQTHISQYFHIHSCLPKKLLLKETRYCNGRFYFLSNEAVNNVLMKKNIIEKDYIEDHSIGLNLDDKYKKNILHFNTNKIFIDDI